MNRITVIGSGAMETTHYDYRMGHPVIVVREFMTSNFSVCKCIYLPKPPAVKDEREKEDLKDKL